MHSCLFVTFFERVLFPVCADACSPPPLVQGMVEGSLGESLSKGTGGSNDDTVKKLSALLLAVDRLSTVEALYCTARMAAVQATWDELAASAPPQLRGGGSDVLAWLPRFLTWLASFLEQEAAWCVRV